jgi:hypothetical protein
MIKLINFVNETYALSPTDRTGWFLRQFNAAAFWALASDVPSPTKRSKDGKVKETR